MHALDGSAAGVIHALEGCIPFEGDGNLSCAVYPQRNSRLFLIVQFNHSPAVVHNPFQAWTYIPPIIAIVGNECIQDCQSQTDPIMDILPVILGLMEIVEREKHMRTPYKQWWTSFSILMSSLVFCDNIILHFFIYKM